MGRFQLELIIILPIFPLSSHPTFVCFFPVGLLSLIRHFQRVLRVLKFFLSPDWDKPGDRRNFNTHKTCLKCINDERPTGKKHTNVGWDDSGKIGKIIINSNLDLIINTFKYHVFAPMGRFQLESIYLYFPPSSQRRPSWDDGGK